MPSGRPKPSTAGTPLTLVTMGGAQLHASAPPAGDGGTPLPDGAKPLMEGGKPLALIAYLASTPGRQARRDQLVDLLWADLEPEAARHALRQTVWYIKKRAGEGVVVADGDMLQAGDRVVADRDAFLAAAAANDHERAVALYAGDFLPEFAAPGGAEFEGWADVERRRLRSLYLRAVEITVRDLLARAHVRQAITRALKAREADPWHQASWRLVLEALIAGREWAQAQLESDEFQRRFAAEELALEPASRALIRAARAGEGDDAAGAADAPPHEMAQLVGREREFSLLLDAVARAQRAQGSHIHLRGAPGVGKTRLLVDFLARLRSTRVRAVLVRSDVGGRELPFATASALALALGKLPGARGISPNGAAALVAMAPALSGFFTVPNDPSTGSEALRNRSQALAELAAAVCDEHPLVILVDDVHWMDGASRTVFAHLAARVSEERILLVSAGRAVVDGRLDDAGAMVVELHPLTDVQVGELVGSLAALGAEPWAARLVPELWRVTGGSPLLVVETLQLLRQRDLLVVEDGEWRAVQPEALLALLREGGALARRVDALSREQRWLLALLGVAGAPVEQATLASAAGGAEGGYMDALAELERRGLVTRADGAWVVAHDELAEAALERASAEGVRAAHAALGRAMWQAGPSDPPAMRRAAQHLAQGGDDAPLHALFGRFVRQLRALGDARSLSVLAEDLLGRHARAVVVREMIRALPWPVRTGLTSTRRVAVALAATLLAILVPTAVAVVRAVAPPPPEVAAELLVLLEHQGTRVARRVPIVPATWIPGRDLEVPDRGDDGPMPADQHFAEHPRQRGTWIFSQWVNDSGGIELFMESRGGPRAGESRGARRAGESRRDPRPVTGGDTDGQRQRLTTAPGDDLLDDVSPDGRFAVFATARWNAESHYDLAVIDLASRAVQRVTRGDATDQYARWNHAGDRIAFRRFTWHDDRGTLCLVNPDGSDLSCMPAIGEGLLPIGWIDDDHVLAVGEKDSDRQLLVVDVRDARVESLDERVTSDAPVLSPDGRWLACACARIGYVPGTWFVMPVGRRAEARPLAVAVGTRVAQLSFTGVGRPPAVGTVSIEGGPSLPVVGVAHRFTAHGLVAGRRTDALERVRWHSLDARVLTIDSVLGVARPLRPGVARVVARVPGWAEATHDVEVRADSAVEIGREDWDGGWESRWFTFGEPRPVVEEHGGVRALDVNGDGSYHSGVVGLARYATEGGVAVDALVSARIQKPQWQVISLALRNSLDLASVSDEDRVRGPVSVHQAVHGGCRLALPAGEGALHSAKFVADIGAERLTGPLPAAAREGRRLPARVQLFPDGRCGVALDGRAVFVSEGRMVPAGEVQVMIAGSSVDTDMLVAAIRVWRGVPGGVQWGDLQPAERRRR